MKKEDWECGDECAEVIDAWENYDWETCGDCLWNTCIEECEHCDWDNEDDACWDECMDCWDPAGCAELSDWGEDDEWATETCAMTCWVHTNPCNWACPAMPVPSEECLTCLDENDYLAGIHPMTMIKTHENPSMKMFVKGDHKGDGDWECGHECEELDAWEDYDWETCGDCMYNTCIDECECDWSDENDECWDGCMDCWDPAGCIGVSDWGEDDEWASEACAMGCWVKTNPCNWACPDLPMPDEDCL